jgi:hypothetical protein
MRDRVRKRQRVGEGGREKQTERVIKGKNNRYNIILTIVPLSDLKVRNRKR